MSTVIQFDEAIAALRELSASEAASRQERAARAAARFRMNVVLVTLSLITTAVTLGVVFTTSDLRFIIGAVAVQVTVQTTTTILMLCRH